MVGCRQRYSPGLVPWDDEPRPLFWDAVLMEHQYVFPKTSFDAFFCELACFGKVFAPVKVSDQSFAFRPVDSAGEIAFEALRTILPPKKFFYPQQEVIVRYEDGVFEEVRPEPEQRVVFGVHPCDLA